MIAASLASAPELQKNALPPKLRSESSLGPAALRLGVPGVGHVDQLGHLLLHRLDHARRTVPQQIAAPAREEVEILPPLVVPDMRPLTAHQRHREPFVVRDHVFFEQLVRLRGDMHSWFVVAHAHNLRANAFVRVNFQQAASGESGRR